MNKIENNSEFTDGFLPPANAELREAFDKMFDSNKSVMQNIYESLGVSPIVSRREYLIKRWELLSKYESSCCFCGLKAPEDGIKLYLDGDALICGECSDGKRWYEELQNPETEK
jgi:hypothetical protein